MADEDLFYSDQDEDTQDREVKQEATGTDLDDDDEDPDYAASQSGRNTGTGKRVGQTSYGFPPRIEERLVRFFASTPCFWDKSAEHFGNTAYKDSQLVNLARQIKSQPHKIAGWFKNQRTAVGKLYKRRSHLGPSAVGLTNRQRWQEKSFAFLQQAIHPRSYSKDLASLDTSELPSVSDILSADFDDENNDDDDDANDNHEVVEVMSSACSTSQTRQEPRRERTPRRRPAKRAKTLEDAVTDFLAPTEETRGVPLPPSENSLVNLDERAVFGSWFASRLHRIPESRWESFHFAIIDVVRNYTDQGQGHSGGHTSHRSQAWQNGT